MEKVVILKCPEYDKACLDENIRKAFSCFGGIEKIVRPGDKVLLKPNLLVRDLPESGINTHPFFVKAVADIVKAGGGLPFVGDSPAFGSVRQVAEGCGLLRLMEIDNIPIVSFKGNRSYNENVRITGTINDFDRIINLPKLKAHSQMLFTGAVKNLYGLVAGKVKTWRHFAVRSDCEKFSLMLLALHKQVQPCFTLVDAVDIMEKSGPRRGVVKRAGLIFGGVNCISIDRVICEVFGIDPEKVPLLNAARKHGFRGWNLDDIQIVGRAISDVSFPTELEDISFTFPNVVRSVLRHVQARFGGRTV
ncbi:MAG: DUF362 domain-containing protein [Deltaproteobacteria bacterium]|nr:DUF362 domain-containing protein [Deltaproteobacteria bacterium]